ncbi:lipoprotein [Spiroplasma citri]
MKRLLTLFSVFVLGFGSSLGVVSCTTVRAKHERDDNDELDRN